MPRWGRPPGARRGRYERTSWAEDVVGGRFEELGDEESDGEWAWRNRRPRRDRDLQAYRAWDERYGALVSRSGEYCDQETDPSDDMSDSQGELEDDPQLSLRDKEERLVQNAIDRILRAQLKGKANVNLTQSELDALRRKRQLEGSASSARTRSSGLSGRDSERLRGGTRKDAALGPGVHTGSRRSLPLPDDYNPSYTSGTASGYMSASRNPDFTYSPAEFYRQATQVPPRTPDGLRGQREPAPSPPSNPYRHGEYRFSSAPDISRQSGDSSMPRAQPRRPQLPHEEDWVPPGPPYPVDPFQFMTYAPPDSAIPSHLQPRRGVSGPADVHYAQSRASATRSRESIAGDSADSTSSSDSASPEEPLIPRKPVGRREEPARSSRPVRRSRRGKR